MILTQPDAEVAAWEQMTGTSIQAINLIPTMTPQEYLKEVAQTIATHGHRGSGSFIEAARVANGGLTRAAYAVEGRTKQEAQYVRDVIKQGLAYYMPGSNYFEPYVAVEYAALVAKFNSVS